MPHNDQGPPQRRNRPGRTTQAAPKSIAQDILSVSPDAWHEAPSAADRAEAHVLAIAYSLGYRLAVRCTRCGQWLVAPSSVRRHLGPVCAAKAVG